MNKRRGIVWFRSDLRLHDNEALTEAVVACDEILPVYIFDDRLYQGETEYGFEKISSLRAAFIVESVKVLRQNLLDVGSQLIVLRGETEHLIAELARAYRTKWVFCNRERTREEVEIQDAVEDALWSIGQEIRYSRGKMLLYTADLPFPVTHTPDRFSTFKKEVAYIPIREPLPVPNEFETVEMDDGYGAIPDCKELGKTDENLLKFRGGETQALLQLDSMLDDIKEGKQIAEDVLSPWITTGCLSPKVIHKRLRQVQNRANKAVIDELIVHLLRRDHFRFMGKKFGDLIFQRGGIQQLSIERVRDDAIIESWCKGQTDHDLVNAAMRALVNTGYLSYPMRVFVASYFVFDLKQDWLVGAQFFESHLIDYDPCSNYGNWNRLAGVGAVIKEVHFSLDHQTKMLDPEGVFVKKWLG